jgi:hypothetical protein
LIDEKPKPRRLSDIVTSINTGEPLAIGSLVDAFGERAFGALMFVFAVPNVIPTPPGTSAVLGLPLVILTFQLMIGRQALWLPEKIRQRTLAASLVSSFAQRAVPILMRFEKILRPRVSLVVISNLAERIIGIVAFALAVILFLPIPLGNILPAAAIACMALGLAERDGLAVLLGYAIAAASIFVLGLVSSALYAAAKTFISVLFGM